MTTPLMLWLARNVYERQKDQEKDKDPGELADQTRFRSRAALEHHLLADFVPAVYASRLDESGDRAQFLCTPQQAQRWLAFLAGDLHIRHTPHDRDRDRDRDRIPGTSYLAWWRFTEAARGWRLVGMAIRAMLLSGLVWALAIWVLSPYGNWHGGHYVGSLPFRSLLLDGPLGQLIRPTVDQMLEIVPDNARNAPGILVHDLFVMSREVPAHARYAILLVVMFGLGYLRLFVTWDRMPMTLNITRDKVIRILLRNMVFLALVSLSVMTLTTAVETKQFDFSVVFGMHSTWVTLLAFCVLGARFSRLSFATPIDVSRSVSPAEVLRLDRQADIVATLLSRGSSGVVVWLFSAPRIALAYTIFAGTATLVAVVLGGQGAFASRAYTDACFWLACGRRLPWRTRSFLLDAYHRGVFRQVGAVYQFRHIRLQNHLHNRWWHRWEALRDRIWTRLGRREGTLAAISEAVDRYRELAQTNRAMFLPDLAEALRSQATKLWFLGRKEESLASSSEAVDIYRELALTNPIAFRPDLARALGDLASTLGRLGWRDEQLALIGEAVDIYFELAQTDLAAFETDWAGSLVFFDWSMLCEEGLAGTREAVDIYRRLADTYRELAEAKPIVFRRHLAQTLHDFAFTLRILERRDEQLDVISEAVGIYRELAEEELAAAEIRRKLVEADPYAFSPTLVVDKLAYRRATAERREEALAATSEAVNTFRKLAEQVSVGFLPVLAERLDKLAFQLHVAGREEDARAASAEAGKIRTLSWRHFTSLWPARDRSLDHLHDLAAQLWKTGLRQEAVAAGEIRRKLVGAHSAENTSASQRRRSEREEPAATRETVRFWRAEARRWRSWSDYRRRNLTEPLSNLAEGLGMLAFELEMVGRREDALDATNEEVNTYRTLTKTHPARFWPYLTTSLDTLAFQLRVAGRQKDALAAVNEAAGIRRKLGTTGNIPHPPPTSTTGKSP